MKATPDGINLTYEEARQLWGLALATEHREDEEHAALLELARHLDEAPLTVDALEHGVLNLGSFVDDTEGSRSYED